METMGDVECHLRRRWRLFVGLMVKRLGYYGEEQRWIGTAMAWPGLRCPNPTCQEATQAAGAKEAASGVVRAGVYVEGWGKRYTGN